MTRFRGSQQGLHLQRNKSQEEEMTQTERREAQTLKTTYVFGSFQADCYAVPIPDIPEAAWLALGSEWLILEQHVLHSSNHLSSHKQGRAPHQQGRALCLSICTLKKFSFTISFTSGKGHSFFHQFLKAHPHFLGPVTPDLPRNLMMLCNLSLQPFCPVGLGREEAGEATRTPSGDRCRFGKILPLVLLPSQQTTHTL